MIYVAIKCVQGPRAKNRNMRFFDEEKDAMGFIKEQEKNDDYNVYRLDKQDGLNTKTIYETGGLEFSNSPNI